MTHADIATIADIARVHGADRPDSVALVAGGRNITFAELDSRSNRVAQALRAAGVRFGDRVAFVEKNGAEFFEVVCGAAKLGAVAEAIEHRLTAVETLIVIGPHTRWPCYEDWLARHPDEDPGGTTEPGDLALLMYTSGTTGAPKGVMLSNRNYLSKTVGVADEWRFTPDSVSLAVMPLFHMAGSGWALVGLYQGCPTVVLRDVDPPAILEAITRHRVTNMLLVPAVIARLLVTPGIEDADVLSLRVIVYGASPISDDVLLNGLARFDCEFIQVYGMTETTGSITQLDGVDHDPLHPPQLLRSCGRPNPWVDIRIVDADGHDVPAGTVGELWTRSPQNMLGYWRNPEATAATIAPDGWLKTGDAGYLDNDGYLYLHDRVKDMIVSGGENVYPAEVENVLMTHPHVGDVAVIGVPDGTWGEAVKAVVVPAAEATPAEAELIAFARRHLAGYKLPKSVDFAAELPRNPSGKLLKRELREPYWEGVERRVR